MTCHVMIMKVSCWPYAHPFDLSVTKNFLFFLFLRRIIILEMNLVKNNCKLILKKVRINIHCGSPHKHTCIHTHTHTYRYNMQCFLLKKKIPKMFLGKWELLTKFSWSTLRNILARVMEFHQEISCRSHMTWFQVSLSLWSVTHRSCIDKIPEVAKTKVSKPKINSL